MKAAIEQIFNGSINQVAVDGAYDPTKINRGKHTGQYNLGPGETDKFIGPCPVGVANFGESSLAIPASFVHPIKITDDLFWIFGSDTTTAAATRRVQLWTWAPSTNVYNFVGAVTLTFPTTGNVTTRGLRVILENYTTGTVGVSGTAVTGSGTGFTTQCVGSRIGFGSTDPTQITTWYQISAIGSDTSITLTSSVGTISSGTPYVIQDLMIVHANTNVTLTNGGLFVAKGLQYADFTNPATTIPAATTVDKIKAVYWLKDAATVTNTVIGGCAFGDRNSWTQQYVYSTDGATTTLKLFKYNIRAPLTSLSAGAQVLAGTDIVITGAQTVTGNVSQANNGRVATLNHGPGAGVPSLYLFTASRILRVPLSLVTSSSTTFIADQMSENPPGGSNTNVPAGTTAFVSLDVAGSIDKLVIAAAAGSTNALYITDYYTGGQQFDRRGCSGTGQLPSANRDPDSPIYVHYSGTGAPFVWVEDGWLFWIFGQIVTANVNALSVYPLAADYMYQSDINNRIICPKITLGTSASKLYRVVVNCMENLGGDMMGVAPDMFKIQVRTSGIDDNTGGWFDVPQTGDLSGIEMGPSIQFAFLFRTAGAIMLPARILSLALIYEKENALPDEYQWNFNDFNLSNGTFAWTQQTAFADGIMAHTINIYRSDNNILALTQNSSGTTNGNFQYYDGSTWINGLGPNTIGTRRRFVPSGSLPAGVSLYAKITVA